jgi:RNA polymerase sigma-70 factor (ECF subfamily)
MSSSSNEPEQGAKDFELTPSKFNIAPPERQTLRNIARQTIGNQLEEKVDASDIVQDSLTAAWTARGDFRGESRNDFFGWLKSIVKNRALNAIRFFHSRRRLVSRETPGQTESAAGRLRDEHTPSESAIRRENAVRVVALLEALPEAERRAVSMRYLEDLPLDVIANQLGRTHAATAGVLKRGMKRLRELMCANNGSEVGQ